MKFALDVATSGEFADVELLASLAAEAEAASWDGFFIWDVLLGAGEAQANERVVDPWVALTAIAVSTSRIRFGAFMTPLARRRPWDVARSVATLDCLSAGRITFGAGLGFRPEEFRAIGEDPDPMLRAEKLDEGLAIIDALWQGGPVTFKGHHYNIGPVCILPSPLQVPRVPIWTACGWPHLRPLRRAARFDGVYLMTLNQDTQQMLQPGEVQAVASYVAEHRSADSPFDIALNGDVSGDADPSGTIARFERAGATWWIELCADTPSEERDRVRAGPPPCAD